MNFLEEALNKADLGRELTPGQAMEVARYRANNLAESNTEYWYQEYDRIYLEITRGDRQQLVIKAHVTVGNWLERFAEEGSEIPRENKELIQWIARNLVRDPLIELRRELMELL